MKLRSDFVSNSSSSSFIVMGSWVSIPEDKRSHEYIDSLNLGDEIRWIYSDSDEVVIGLPFESMKDDETLKQFKERVAIILSKIPGKTFNISDIGIIRGVSHDGEFYSV